MSGCVYKSERDKHGEGRGRRNSRKSSNYACFILQASFGLFFVKRVGLIRDYSGRFLVFEEMELWTKKMERKY